MNRTTLGAVLLALLVVAGMSVPSIAIGSTPNAGTVAAKNAQQNDAAVSVTAGHQLATVISVSSDSVHTEFENTAFELSIEGTDEETQAETIAKRAEVLRDRAEAIREDYEAATEAYEAGELTRAEYAQRLADLNARASNLLSSYEQLNKRAENVSGLELRAAGANLSSLDGALENLSSVTGPGSSALLGQYLGETDGKIELETTDGLKIEVERDGGESSREFKRARDDNMTITVSHGDALQTARGALASPAAGHWVLAESKVKSHEGAWAFEFVLVGSANLTGEAEVRVDGSTGEIYRLEQETQRGDDDRDAEGEADDEHDELVLQVVEGTPEPNAAITIQVLGHDGPVSAVSVLVNDHAIGTTGQDGTINVTLPASGDAEITAESDDAEGELEFDFDDEQDDAAVFDQLDVSASHDNGTVTVEVRFDGEPVRNATVYANDHRAGKTNGEGAVTFAFDATATNELELEIVKGHFEAELTFAVHDGDLVLTEEEHEGDGDKADEDEDDDQDHEDDEGDTDEDDTVEDEDDDQAHDDERDEEDGQDELTIHVVEGTPEPNATITVEVRVDGEPVEGATVTLDGDFVDTTDANGTVEVTLPDDDDAELRAEHGDAEGRLEFEFDDHEED